MERIPELFAPNLICVCIDEFSAQNCQGRLYTQYDAEPFPFLSLIDMTLHKHHCPRHAPHDLKDINMILANKLINFIF